ncbi:MAG: hypothetical protein JNG84_14625 [Archangium sp.]|nr:hypothetical protein [Archangium sp.]
MRANQARPRGYILVLILIMLTVLSILTAGVYTQASESLIASQGLVAQKVAASRADLAVQLAVERVKSGTVNTATFEGTCNGPNDSVLRANSGCIAGSFVSIPRVQGAVTGNFALTDGWQYQYWMFRRPQVLPDGGALAISPQLINIYAEGYYGNGDGGTSFTVAAVEAEVVVVQPPGGTQTPDGDYGSMR